MDILVKCFRSYISYETLNAIHRPAKEASEGCKTESFDTLADRQVVPAGNRLLMLVLVPWV